VNRFETGLLLLAIPPGLIAAGYGLVAMLRTLSAAERLAAAMFAGFCAVLWTVSVVNLALPLDGIWGWTCVVPLVCPLWRETTRAQLVADLAAFFGDRRGSVAVVTSVLFLAALLWPVWSRPDVVFYDGTASHDAFFWIVGAEHLKRHSYLQGAVTSPVYPLFYSIESIAGLHPVWGRMGAEGLLALISNLVGASPLKLYVAASAALFFPWLAAVFLVARTFVLERCTLLVVVCLVALQPLFIFFQANANLPNLVGVIAAALAMVAAARATDGGPGQRGWLLLLALGGHGILCSYPELAPVTALSVALLLGRTWWRGGWRAGAAGASRIMAATLAALVLNPVTTVRAWSGLVSSWTEAQQGAARPAIFATVAEAARGPAMATLSVPLGHDLATIGGLIAATVVLVALVLSIGRARDRWGVMAILAGGGAILVYTIVTGYGYGWQKTVQFSAIFLAALLPVGAVALGLGRAETARSWRAVASATALATIVLFGAATAENLRETYKWSRRKFLTRDWFDAREFTRRALHNAPVLVDARTFERPFFYTMWATYFLDESRVYFAADEVAGGYLRPSVRKYPPDWVQSPRAMLVAGDAATDDGAMPLWRRPAVAIVYRPRAGSEPGPQ
jgi:hypothetical protein